MLALFLLHWKYDYILVENVCMEQRKSYIVDDPQRSLFLGKDRGQTETWSRNYRDIALSSIVKAPSNRVVKKEIVFLSRWEVLHPGWYSFKGQKAGRLVSECKKEFTHKVKWASLPFHAALHKDWGESTEQNTHGLCLNDVYALGGNIAHIRT